GESRGCWSRCASSQPIPRAGWSRPLLRRRGMPARASWSELPAKLPLASWPLCMNTDLPSNLVPAVLQITLAVGLPAERLKNRTSRPIDRPGSPHARADLVRVGQLNPVEVGRLDCSELRVEPFEGQRRVARQRIVE